MHKYLRHSFSLSLTFAAAVLAAQTPEAAPASSPQTVRLDPVVITASLDKDREDIVPSLGATSYRIDASQISLQSLGENSTFNQVLLRTPSMAEDSFGQVHLRGEHANLQYRIDDVLLPEGIAGFGQELDVPFVRTLSLLTGSLPAQYGYRTAGVVDIHTQSGGSAGNAGSLSLFGGSFDTLRVSAGASGARGGWTGFATASAETNGLGIENPAPGRSAIHDRANQAKAFADVSYLIDPSSRITLLAGASSARFQIPDNPGQAPAFAVGTTDSFDSALLNENQDEASDYAVLAYQKTSAGFSGQVSAFARYSLTHFIPDTIGDLAFNGVSSDVRQDLASDGFEADGKWPAAAAHTVRAGMIVLATNANTATRTAVFPANADGGQAGAVPFVIDDNHHKLGWLYGAYVQDEWKPASGLTVNAGVRADKSAGYLSEGQVSPRLNAVYRLGGAATVHAGYARYFTPPPLELEQTPALAKFAGTSNAPAVPANSPIRSERSDYFDAGLSLQPCRDFSVTFDGYYKKAANQLDEGQFGAALIFAAFNYRVGHVTGAEISANYSHGGFSAYANVAPGRATGREIISGEFQFDPGELAYIAAHDVHLDHDQALTASAGASYARGGTSVFADFLYGSGLRSGFANTGHVPEYHPVNAGIGHEFALGDGRKLTVRLDVTNLFDESYALRDGSGIGVFAPQYAPRRGFYATATWRL
jgi:hypothetical protein